MSNNVDLRSLAIFRVLLGSYLIYDIISRLQHGKYSLLWYTSTADGSYLDADDTPHRSPIHRIWFYRGSASLQIILFCITFFLGLSFTLGLKCNRFTKTLLWLNVAAMQCRCMPVHDGSDTYYRHLLLWCTFIPVEKVWSIDSMSQNENKGIETKSDLQKCKVIQIEKGYNALPVFAVKLQIVLMYVGTVLHRSLDLYGFSMKIFQCKWLPPQLTAVHYALGGSFATRDIALGDFVRSNIYISKFMTLTAILIEGIAPIMCLTLKKRAYIPQILLVKLHFGLLLLMNLPNWQLVAMAATSIFTPTSMIDKIQRQLSKIFPNTVKNPVPSSPTSMKKKDMDDCAVAKNKKAKRKSMPFIAYFFFFYMLYDFGGNRNWYTKIDAGDIGEFLRFSQYWVMYSGPPTTTSHALLTGSVGDTRGIDVWQWIKNSEIQRVDIEAFQEGEIWTNFTHVYPSPRFERAMLDLSKINDKQRTQRLLQGICEVTPFDELTFIVQNLDINPPGSDTRFSRRRPDTSTTITC